MIASPEIQDHPTTRVAVHHRQLAGGRAVDVDPGLSQSNAPAVSPDDRLLHLGLLDLGIDRGPDVAVDAELSHGAFSTKERHERRKKRVHLSPQSPGRYRRVTVGLTTAKSPVEAGFTSSPIVRMSRISENGPGHLVLQARQQPAGRMRRSPYPVSCDRPAGR